MAYVSRMYLDSFNIYSCRFPFECTDSSSFLSHWQHQLGAAEDLLRKIIKKDRNKTEERYLGLKLLASGSTFPAGVCDSV